VKNQGRTILRTMYKILEALEVKKNSTCGGETENICLPKK
jgi:hypothetical protein